jgi:hypothetical protein
MRGLVVGAVVGCVLWSAFAWAEDKQTKFTYLDLQPQANQKLKESLGGDGNDLAEVPQGEQTLAGVKFNIGEGLIQLGSMTITDKSEKVEGIKVDRKLTKLYILHSIQVTVEDDTIIGAYTVNYDDKSQETIAIVYGKDVRDWWSSSDDKEATRGKVAWTGENAAVKNAGGKLRLFLTTWKNPEPGKKVVSIDFASTKTASSPFCVAMSVE